MDKKTIINQVVNQAYSDLTGLVDFRVAGIIGGYFEMIIHESKLEELIPYADDIINTLYDKFCVNLSKNITDDDIGLIHNTVEIADAINDKGIPDIDSIPGNQLDGEDDLSYADAIIGVSTGLSIGVLPVVLVGIIVIVLLSISVWRIIEKRRYV